MSQSFADVLEEVLTALQYIFRNNVDLYGIIAVNYIHGGREHD
jgi:hypothetical protein